MGWEGRWMMERKKGQEMTGRMDRRMDGRMGHESVETGREGRSNGRAGYSFKAGGMGSKMGEVRGRQ